MTKTTKMWVGGVAILALMALALPSIVTAQYAKPGSPDHGASSMKLHTAAGFEFGRGGEAMREALELSDEQVSQLDAIRLSHQQEQLRLRGQIDAAEAELKALLLDPEVSRDSVQSAGKQLQDLRGQAQSQQLQHQMDVRELLTPEQRATWVKFESRRGGRRGHGLHRGGGPHMDCEGCGRGQGHRMHQRRAPFPQGPALETDAPVEGERL